MIIDLILDRRENEKDGIYNYSAETFYRECMEYNTIFEGIANKITYAMDYLENTDVQKAICTYITENEYDSRICDYINNVQWI